MNKKYAIVLLFICVIITGTLSIGYRLFNKQPEPTGSLSTDFDTIHAATSDDPNKFIVLGNVRIELPRKNLSNDLRLFLGRWEGYNTDFPAKNDLKIALVISTINSTKAEGILYYGYNIQYPAEVKNISFTVSKNNGIVLESPIYPGNNDETNAYIKLKYTKETDSLSGRISPGNGTARFPGSNTSHTIELNRTVSFYVYKNYQSYLAGLRIYPEEFRNAELDTYGNAYLIYLPEEYERNTEKRWPLLFFLHGMGDRGTNVFLLTKASPFKMIREKGPLPFIIIAPLLNDSPDFFSFPARYIDGVLDEIMENWRIDEKRVYLTGLSLGGEASYRFTLQHPEKIAAMASLGGLLAPHAPHYYQNEIKELDGIPLSRMKDVPVWEIHSKNDAIVPLYFAQNLVNDFNQAGITIKLTVLGDHDHNIWSDTYTDPEFYKWFLQYKKGSSPEPLGGM